MQYRYFTLFWSSFQDDGINVTKENEISAAPELVTPELLKGRIYSADAMHTQKNWCRQVIRAGGHYLLIAKKNQATLHEDLVLYLDDA